MNWIKATDSLPERYLNSFYSNHVLCCNRNTIFVGFYFHDTKEWQNAFNERGNADVDYWMPLPKNPMK